MPWSGGTNVLADVLRAWFGPEAGRPGTGHQVCLSPGPPWRLEPVRRTGAEEAGPLGGVEGAATEGAASDAVDGMGG